MDPSSDYHFLNQILWKRVKLTLVCGIFEGVIQHVDPNKIIVLKKGLYYSDFSTFKRLMIRFGCGSGLH